MTESAGKTEIDMVTDIVNQNIGNIILADINRSD